MTENPNQNPEQKVLDNIDQMLDKDFTNWGLAIRPEYSNLPLHKSAEERCMNCLELT